jgi:hypothetical protein
MLLVNQKMAGELSHSDNHTLLQMLACVASHKNDLMVILSGPETTTRIINLLKIELKRYRGDVVFIKDY